MIFEISCLILKKKKKISNFHFFKTVIFGYFWILAKNTPKLQELFKKRSKSLIYPIIFHISLKQKFTFQHWLFFLDLWYGIGFVLLCEITKLYFWSSSYLISFSSFYSTDLSNLSFLETSTSSYQCNHRGPGCQKEHVSKNLMKWFGYKVNWWFLGQSDHQQIYIFFILDHFSIIIALG